MNEEGNVWLQEEGVGVDGHRADERDDLQKWKIIAGGSSGDPCGVKIERVTRIDETSRRSRCADLPDVVRRDHAAAEIGCGGQLMGVDDEEVSPAEAGISGRDGGELVGRLDLVEGDDLLRDGFWREDAERQQREDLHDPFAHKMCLPVLVRWCRWSLVFI